MSVIAFSAILFAAALAFALVLTPVVRAGARKLGALDHPDGNRKLHSTPIPKLGGVAVFGGVYIVIAALLPLHDSAAAGAAIRLAWQCFPAALLVLGLGMADDLWPLKPWMKVLVQVIAALMICSYPELRIAKMSNPFGLTVGGIGILSIPLTIVWIVLITNAFNIVDGVDGLASGVAFVATACLFLAAIQRPDDYTALLVAPLAGALVGFLRYNFAPASIFLGDSGSLLLGFLIAVLSVAGENKSSTAIAIAAPMLFLALPLGETGVSILRRFLRGQPIWHADTGHFHHQLIRRGFSARRAALILYAGSGLFGAASLLLYSSRVVGGVVTITMVIVAWVGIQQMGYSEFSEVKRAFARGLFYQRRIIQNSIRVRKLLEDLRRVHSLVDAWPVVIEALDTLRFARVALVTPPPVTWKASGVSIESFPEWTSPGAMATGADCLKTSVHVDVPGLGEIRLELWRSRQEDPLHSEFPVLLDVLSQELPRILRTAGTSLREPTPYGVTFDRSVAGHSPL
jgi:UDP-GlcNAc:undecaprenyl-phosphate GlcNAc-1-phosphate transferase